MGSNGSDIKISSERKVVNFSFWDGLCDGLWDGLCDADTSESVSISTVSIYPEQKINHGTKGCYKRTETKQNKIQSA